MANRWLSRLIPKPWRNTTYLRDVVTGSLYRISDLRGNTDLAEIKTKIDTMRALAKDSQISTALSYYATDATTCNTSGDIIWATPIEEKHRDIADVINALFHRWKLNTYVRDHILELATIGNLYIPTTTMYREDSGIVDRDRVALDNNTIPEPEFDIIPSYKVPPEDIVHLFVRGEPVGYIYHPEDSVDQYDIYPEEACIHFSLGGLLGDYTIGTKDVEGNETTYDVKFATPLMESAVQPTQTLNLLEDANILSSLSRVVKFVNVDCGDASEEEEIKAALQDIKDAIEQQLAINTNSGDAQSFVNPQSPNNLIFLPKGPGGSDPVSITDLNMSESTDQDSKLLEYYQNKKLSVLGVPKEALNFSSNEGLGGAGTVLSQRSALYANCLQRLETAYIEGWTDALNKYFKARNMSGFVNQFKLHMNPILTQQSTLQFEKRDAALGQAQTLVDLLKNISVTEPKYYKNALIEILTEVFPQIGADVMKWDIDIDVEEGEEGGAGDEF